MFQVAFGDFFLLQELASQNELDSPQHIQITFVGRRPPSHTRPQSRGLSHLVDIRSDLCGGFFCVLQGFDAFLHGGKRV